MVPVVRQHDESDCGPSCLQALSRFYGKDVQLEELRRMCALARDGASLLDLSRAAVALGFESRGVLLSWETLSGLSVPCIISWNRCHFVVFSGVRRTVFGERVVLMDPAAGRLSYKLPDFRRGWDEGTGCGIALLLLPGPVFSRSPRRRGFASGRFRGLGSYVMAHRWQLSGVLLMTAAAGLLNLAVPQLTRRLVDSAVAGGDIGLVGSLLLLQAAIAVGQMACSFVSGALMLNAGTSMGIELTKAFMLKLTRLPIAFFDARSVADLLQRLTDNDRVRDYLTESLLGTVVAVCMLVLYSVMLARYGAGLIAVFLVSGLIYVLWTLLFIEVRRKMDYVRFQESSRERSSVLELISGMQEIKLDGCEHRKVRLWERAQERLLRVSRKSLSLRYLHQAGGTLIDQTKNILISYVAARSVIEGRSSLGVMMAVQYVIGQLNAPLSDMVSFVSESQDAALSMERMSEVLGRDEELAPQDDDGISGNEALSLEHVCFSYSPGNTPPSLKDVSLDFLPGEVNAIVGASGSGKTTVMKLLLGFYEPQSGSVLIGGRPLSGISPVSWRKACGCVMQDGFIFSDTVAGNIAPCEDNPDMEKVRRCAMAARILEWVESLPKGFSTRIGADGVGVSAGQKQRILIARALYRDCSFLFLDEATNALDSVNESGIMENLSDYFPGKTVVVIAHRLSTIRGASRIIVLDEGRVAEVGTHSELMSRKGVYACLVRSQLA